MINLDPLNRTASCTIGSVGIEGGFWERKRGGLIALNQGERDYEKPHLYKEESWRVWYREQECVQEREGTEDDFDRCEQEECDPGELGGPRERLGEVYEVAARVLGEDTRRRRPLDPREQT